MLRTKFKSGGESRTVETKRETGQSVEAFVALHRSKVEADVAEHPLDEPGSISTEYVDAGRTATVGHLTTVFHAETLATHLLDAGSIVFALVD